MVFHRSFQGKSPKMVLRYLTGTLWVSLIRSSICLFPLRAWLIRLLGGRVGRHCRFNRISFLNFHRKGFSNLKVGDNVYIGEETMIDIADEVCIGSNATIAERVFVLTHTNVGYDDHPLKKEMPDMYAPVRIGEHSFIGAGSYIMPGVVIGENSVVGAMSLVLNNVEAYTIVAGVPARCIRKIER